MPKNSMEPAKPVKKNEIASLHKDNVMKRGPRMLAARAFAEEMGISENQLLGLMEKYPETFSSVTRIFGLPRFEVSRWAPIVKNLLALPVPSEKARTDLPPVSGTLDDDEKGNGHVTDVITYGESRATKELYAARIAKLDFLKRASKLVEIAAVVKAWRDIAISVQKSVLSVPDRVAPLLVGEQDLVVIRNRMRQELLHALKHLSFAIAGEQQPEQAGAPKEKSKHVVSAAKYNPSNARGVTRGDRV